MNTKDCICICLKTPDAIARRHLARSFWGFFLVATFATKQAS
jgi:hypothetical protein